MEYPFSPKEKGSGYWVSSKAQVENPVPCDSDTRNSISEDPFNNFTELMNFDAYAGWCNSPTVTDQMFTSYGLPSGQTLPYASFDALNIMGQNSSVVSDGGGASNAIGSSYNCGDRMIFQQTTAESCYPIDPKDANDLVPKPTNDDYRDNILDTSHYSVSRPIPWSFDEKMLRALSVFKESSGGGVLAQVWVPIRRGDQCILSTSDQPYLLDQMFAGYREVSRTYTFSAEMKPGSTLDLPGRVFISKVPEWTSDVIYYNEGEYLRVTHAVKHAVRGSIAIPIFDSPELPCCAVLELVTMKETPNFDLEMESLCNALLAVNLRTTAPPPRLPQCISRNQRAALAEITDVLRAVCHAHRLPLALTWILCNYNEEAVDEITEVCVKERSKSTVGKNILCIESTACYVNDREMQGFVHACAEHYLEEGQGMVGKALQSNHPFLFSNVKSLDISEYPLVHHARKFGLNAAVAIRFRSTYTGDDDYILEFFLPISMTGSSEQQLLLNNLSGTMQRICRNLRTVSDAELVGDEGSKVGFQKGVAPNFPPMGMSRRSSHTTLSDSDLNSIDRMSLNVSISKIDGIEAHGSHEQVVVSGSRRHLEKKRSTAEKNVSLSDLQQYFSGSLKDAAKSIGVCRNTLERICRQHGISRWSSHKINKVNRLLRTIQTVLDSVQGVEGGLNFDPATGGFVAAGSIMQEFDAQRSFLFPEKNLPVRNSELITQDATSMLHAHCIDVEKSAIKVEEDECSMNKNQAGPVKSILIPNTLDKSSIYLTDCSEDSKLVAIDTGPFQPARLGTANRAYPENGSMSSYTRGEKWAVNKDSMKLENSDCHLVSRSACSLAAAAAAAEEMDTRMEGGDGIVEHNQPFASRTTASSNSSGSLVHGSSSNCPTFEEGKHSKVQPNCGEMEISHIRQQSGDNEMAGLDLGKSERNKKRKLRSDVWKDFEKYEDEDGNDRARCNLCKKDFDGSSLKGTTHLRNHFKSCQRKGNGGGGGETAKAEDLRNQIAIKKITVMDQQLNHLDTARMIFKQGDTSLLNSTNAAYIIDVYSEEKEKLRKYFDKLSCRFCLTIDEVGSTKYTCLTVYFIDDDWKLKKKIIGFKYLEKNETVVNGLKTVLLESGIDNNISSMVVGDTDKYGMSSDERENWFGGQGSLPFNSNLLFVDSFSYIVDASLRYFKRSLHHCTSRIFDYIRETSSKNEKFRIAIDQAKSLGKQATAEVIPMKLELEKQWRDDNIVGVVEYALGLEEAFFELENVDPDFRSIKKEWDQMRVFYECYGDFADVAFLKHWRNYETANMHFPLLCSMYQKSLLLAKHNFYFNDEEIVRFIKKADNYWCEYNLVLAVAAVLDPRFQMNIVKHWYKEIYGDECETQLAKFKNYFTSVYNEYASGTNNFKSCTLGSQETTSSISYKMLDPSGKSCKSSQDPDHVRSLNLELFLFLEEVKFPLIEDFNILEWWRDNTRYFPTLARMARDFLSLQISTPLSVPSKCSEILVLASSNYLDSDMSREAFICTNSWYDDASTRRDPSLFECVLSAQGNSPSLMSLSTTIMHSKKQEKLKGNGSQTLTSTSFIESFPIRLRPYIRDVNDVPGDGNCGFRVVASLMDMGDDWIRARRDLIDELQQHYDYYAQVFGYRDRAQEVMHSLSYFDANPGIDRWMIMPDAGHLIASRYNVVLLFLSQQQCLTFLPLRSIPLPRSSHRIIAIGLVNDCHFVQVSMFPSSPMPPIASNWHKYHYPWAEGWATPYVTNIDAFRVLVSDGAEQRTISIDS